MLTLVELARSYDGKQVVSADRIAKRYAIPRKFLETILSELKAHGLVSVLRGPKGGYRLAKEPTTILVADVVRMIDGALAPVASASVHFYQATPLEQEPKATHLFKDIRDYTAQILEGTSIQDLL